MRYMDVVLGGNIMNYRVFKNVTLPICKKVINDWMNEFCETIVYGKPKKYLSNINGTLGSADCRTVVVGPLVTRTKSL